jgi:transporter family-2 protein
MVKLFYVFLTLIGGLMIGLQAPINSSLGKKIGGFEGAFVSFLIGTVVLFLLIIFFGKGNILQIATVSRWQLLGGILGTFFVTVIILSVPHIGVASAILATILGQLLIGLIIDHFGFFGVQRIVFDWNRLVGVLLLISALYFIFRGNISS